MLELAAEQERRSGFMRYILIGIAIICVLGLVVIVNQPRLTNTVSVDPSSNVPVTKSIRKSRANTFKLADPKTPYFPDGQIINEFEYVAAFARVNAGLNGLNQDQLLYLGQESWAAYKSLDDQSFFDIFRTSPEEKFFHDWNRISEANHRNELAAQSSGHTIPPPRGLFRANGDVTEAAFVASYIEMNKDDLGPGGTMGQLVDLAHTEYRAHEAMGGGPNWTVAPEDIRLRKALFAVNVVGTVPRHVDDPEDSAQ